MNFRYLMVFEKDDLILGLQFFTSLVSISQYLHIPKQTFYNRYYNKQKQTGIFKYIKIYKILNK